MSDEVFAQWSQLVYGRPLEAAEAAAVLATLPPVEDSIGTFATITEILEGIPVPELPRDGDCLKWAPVVSEDLYNADYDDARTVTVVGWLAGEVIGFMHKATKVGSLIVDCTARQFDPRLPLRWVVAQEEYEFLLAKVTGVERVEAGE